MSARALDSVVTLAALTLCVGFAACTGGKTVRGYTIETGGDAARGAALINQYRCGACHIIPGIHDARGLVAPPLMYFGGSSPEKFRIRRTTLCIGLNLRSRLSRAPLCRPLDSQTSRRAMLPPTSTRCAEEDE